MLADGGQSRAMRLLPFAAAALTFKRQLVEFRHSKSSGRMEHSLSSANPGCSERDRRVKVDTTYGHRSGCIFRSCAERPACALLTWPWLSLRIPENLDVLGGEPQPSSKPYSWVDQIVQAIPHN